MLLRLSLGRYEGPEPILRTYKVIVTYCTVYAESGERNPVRPPFFMFSISSKQLAKINRWIKKKPFKPVGTIGGRYEYIFIPTALGVIIKVRDSIMGDEIDVTDYLDW